MIGELQVPYDAIRMTSASHATVADDEQPAQKDEGVRPTEKAIRNQSRTPIGALNRLLDEDATVGLLDSGEAVVAPQSHGPAIDVALDLDIAFRSSSAAQVSVVEGGSAKLGYVGNQDDRESLAELGFTDAIPLSAR